MKATCLYPHCSCAGKCTGGGTIPDRDPNVPLFERDKLRELADRCRLAQKVKTDPGFHLSEDDMKAIEFSLRFTATRL